MPNNREIERYVKDKSSMQLQSLVAHRGFPLSLYKHEATIHSKVYGAKAANAAPGNQKRVEIIGILVSDDFVSQGPSSSGLFSEGFLYTTSESVNVGDTVGVPREDESKERLFKVASFEVFGMTQKVFKKWRLVSMEDRA